MTVYTTTSNNNDNSTSRPPQPALDTRYHKRPDTSSTRIKFSALNVVVFMSSLSLFHLNQMKIGVCFLPLHLVHLFGKIPYCQRFLPSTIQLGNHLVSKLNFCRQYAALVFMSSHRFETSKKRSAYLTLDDLIYCARELMQNWTYTSKGNWCFIPLAYFVFILCRSMNYNSCT